MKATLLLVEWSAQVIIYQIWEINVARIELPMAN